MSAPGREFRESEYLGLGLMAVRSTTLIDKLLSGIQISEDEKHVLIRAQKFLFDVASGAKLVNSGVGSNVSATDSVRKFSYSVEPLQLLQQNMQAAEAQSMLEEIAQSVAQTVAEGMDESRRDDLQKAKSFFSELHKFLLELVETSKRRTGSSNFRAVMPTYA